MRLRRGLANPTFSTIVVTAAGFAALEIAAGLVVGGFFAWGRAESLLFFFFRPWMLILAGLWIAAWDRRSRAACYALFLGVAGTSESLLLLAPRRHSRLARRRSLSRPDWQRKGPARATDRPLGCSSLGDQVWQDWVPLDGDV